MTLLIMSYTGEFGRFLESRCREVLSTVSVRVDVLTEEKDKSTTYVE